MAHSAPHLEHFQWFENSILELNNVFLSCASKVIHSRRLEEVKYEIITSLPWSNFEKGLISQEDCQAQILKNIEPGFSEEEIAVATESALSWQPSPEIQSLTNHIRGSYNIYAIGNLAQPALDMPQESSNPLAIFTETFISSQLHERLPPSLSNLLQNAGPRQHQPRKDSLHR